MPSPGDLSNPGIEPASLMSPAWAGRSFSLPLCHLGTQYKWKASFDSDLVVIVKYSTDMILTLWALGGLILHVRPTAQRTVLALAPTMSVAAFITVNKEGHNINAQL